MQDPRTNMKILSMMKELELSSDLFVCHGSGLESLLNALLPREKWLPIPSSFTLGKQGFSYTKTYLTIVTWATDVVLTVSVVWNTLP